MTYLTSEDSMLPGTEAHVCEPGTEADWGRRIQFEPKQNAGLGFISKLKTKNKNKKLHRK